MTICKRAIYTGQVQGVGFRYTTHRLSRSFTVDGTVRNCADGSVELIVQGEPGEVEAFLTAIAKKMDGYIAKQTLDDAPATAMSGFHIIK